MSLYFETVWKTKLTDTELFMDSQCHPNCTGWISLMPNLARLYTLGSQCPINPVSHACLLGNKKHITLTLVNKLLSTDFTVKKTPIHMIQTNEHNGKITLTITFEVSLNWWAWLSFLISISGHRMRFFTTHIFLYMYKLMNDSKCSSTRYIASRGMPASFSKPPGGTGFSIPESL